MSQHRALHFKIERLDDNDNVIEEKTPVLIDGEVKISYSDINRRTCKFSLLEPLPEDWMGNRWKPYYGIAENGSITYYPLGVFIPVNPDEKEEQSEFITEYQGLDKATLLDEAYSDIPITFTAGLPIKEVAQFIFSMIGETKLNFEDLPYVLATDFTFEEGVSLEHIMSTLIRSFAADWYYDRNGYAILENLPVVTQRPVRYLFEEGDNAIHIESSRNFDTSKYWNRVIVVGGRADTGIFRQTYQDDDEITKAGRQITKFFKEDGATSQFQVNQLTAQLLEIGTRLPANIVIQNLPLIELEPKQVIQYKFTKYEVIDFNIPLNTGLQTLSAGEII